MFEGRSSRCLVCAQHGEKRLKVYHRLIRVIVCPDYRLVTAFWIETRYDQPAHTELAHDAEGREHQRLASATANHKRWVEIAIREGASCALPKGCKLGLVHWQGEHSL
jgi:hypothetical protein